MHFCKLFDYGYYCGNLQSHICNAAFDLSFASTETKFIKPKTKTQNNIVMFGFFHKKKILFWLFLKKFD